MSDELDGFRMNLMMGQILSERLNPTLRRLTTELELPKDELPKEMTVFDLYGDAAGPVSVRFDQHITRSTCAIEQDLPPVTRESLQDMEIALRRRLADLEVDALIRRPMIAQYGTDWLHHEGQEFLNAMVTLTGVLGKPISEIADVATAFWRYVRTQPYHWRECYSTVLLGGRIPGEDSQHNGD